MSLMSFVVRYTWGKNDKKRDFGLTTPDDVIRDDGIIYGKDEEYNVLDVYRPKEVKEKYPVIFIVHGGAWIYGTKEVYQYYGMSLAQRGFLVVNFSYRLAPENKFPKQLEDVNDVVSWLIDNKEEYKADTDNMFMVGDSAGGHLLSLYSCICTNTEYAKEYSLSVPKGFIPNAIALNCSAFDLLGDGDSKSGRTLMYALLGKKDFEKNMDKISPKLHITKDFPPSFVMSAGGDFLLAQAKNISDLMDKLDIEHELHIYEEDNPKLGHVFHCNMRLPQAKQCNDEECAFFRKHMK